MADSQLLYPYQQRWIEDRSRFKIGMMSRQVGKTFTCTLELVLDCLEAEQRGAKRRWLILSRGERQAQEAMKEGVIRHLQALKIIHKMADIEWEAQIKAMEVTLPGGSRITALPANPDTARGFSGGVLLDEFAFHKDSHAIWRSLYPVVAAGHPVRVVSTPNGKGNRFYELMTDPELDGLWSRHVVDIYKAVEEGLPRDVDELRRGMSDPEGWEQEFELKWIDAATAWLTYDLIDSCEHELAGTPAHYTGGPCFVGVDIGARNDLFVIVVLEQLGDVLWTRDIIAHRRISFFEQDCLLEEVFKKYRVLRCCMDQTGMGEKPVEDAQRRHGSSRVEGVLFTGPNKLTMATIGKEAFEDRKIRIPQGDTVLRADLHKLKKVMGPTGTPRFIAESDAAGHADRTWAMFLALNAGHAPAAEYAYHPVKRRNISGDRDSREIRTTAGFGAMEGAW